MPIANAEAFFPPDDLHNSLLSTPCRTSIAVRHFTNSAICGTIGRMLRYLGAGVRRFGLYPMHIHQRDNWEFFAVLRGKCGPVLNETGPAILQRSHLWIFPPETAHGWKGD